MIDKELTSNEDEKRPEENAPVVPKTNRLVKPKNTGTNPISVKSATVNPVSKPIHVRKRATTTKDATTNEVKPEAIVEPSTPSIEEQVEIMKESDKEKAKKAKEKAKAKKKKEKAKEKAKKEKAKEKAKAKKKKEKEKEKKKKAKAKKKDKGKKKAKSKKKK